MGEKMGEKILVTGGAGFIASFIVDELVRAGHEVRIFDNLDPQVHTDGSKPDYLNQEAEFIQGDVRDYEAFKKALNGMDVVFHKAGAVGVGQSQYQIKKYIDVNTGGTANLLDILVNNKNNVRKLIVAASMSSYGEGRYECEKCGPASPDLRTEEQMAQGDWELYCAHCRSTLKPMPTGENKIQKCNSIYAYSKKDQEDMVMNIGKTYKMPVVALRYFNVYGPRQSLSNPYTGVAAIFMSRIKNNNPPVVYEDGLQTRDFVSVHDIVRANIMSMESDKADYRIFNVGSGISYSIKGIAEKLAEVMGKDIRPDITNKFRKGDVRHCTADISGIKEMLHFTPRISFEEGMRELMEWAGEAEAVDKFEQAAAELRERKLI